MQTVAVMKFIPHFNWSLLEINEMTPFERECYLEMSKHMLADLNKK